MSVAAIIVVAIAGVVVFLAIMFVVVPGLILRRIERLLAPRVAKAVGAEAVVLEDLRAVSLGLFSLGAWQKRGNGALVLTARELLFLQAVPDRETRIPLAAITEVKTVRSHLGKSYGRDLLHVAFDGETGPDSIAWYVRDLPGWQGALRR